MLNILSLLPSVGQRCTSCLNPPIYIYWFLSRKLVVPNAVLIDEPESFLCPRSQYRMADVLAYLSNDRGIQLIVATHSHCFIERIGIESTLISKITSERISVIKPLHVLHSLHSLGYSYREDKFILLEDVGAARFFNNLADSSTKCNVDQPKVGG